MSYQKSPKGEGEEAGEEEEELQSQVHSNPPDSRGLDETMGQPPEQTPPTFAESLSKKQYVTTGCYP